MRRGVTAHQRVTKLQEATANDTTWHAAQIIAAARKLFDGGGTVEQALDCVLEAARREFGVRVVVSAPCRFVVDGGLFTWPEADRG